VTRYVVLTGWDANTYRVRSVKPTLAAIRKIKLRPGERIASTDNEHVARVGAFVSHGADFSLVASNPKRRGRHRPNHHLAGAQVLSRRVESLAYIHAADGKAYKHDFAPGVSMLLLRDGRVELTRTDGKPLWENT
jgi:hypothetical protein